MLQYTYIYIYICRRQKLCLFHKQEQHTQRWMKVQTYMAIVRNKIEWRKLISIALPSKSSTSFAQVKLCDDVLAVKRDNSG